MRDIGQESLSSMMPAESSINERMERRSMFELDLRQIPEEEEEKKEENYESEESAKEDVSENDEEENRVIAIHKLTLRLMLYSKPKRAVSMNQVNADNMWCLI